MTKQRQWGTGFTAIAPCLPAGKFRYEQLKASNKKLELNRSRPLEALVTIKVRVSN